MQQQDAGSKDFASDLSDISLCEPQINPSVNQVQSHGLSASHRAQENAPCQQFSGQVY